MKKTLLSLLFPALCALSCNTSDDTDRCGRVEVTAPSSEVFALESWLASSGISARKDERGFFYVVSRNGSDVRPSVCSNVTVSYTGRLTNGSQFDAANGISFSLSRVIVGWQEGVPLIGEGGSITLYLPPSLAYGSQGSGNVPPNAILVFSIDLIDVR